PAAYQLRWYDKSFRLGLRVHKVIRCTTPALCAFFFVLIGLAFLSQAGLQNDETLFGAGVYEQAGMRDTVHILGHRFPLMLMSYLGALKSWAYAPIFRFWRPSAASIRVPVILAG